ncbi:MAG: DUF22 domain-containing protein [Candidatus Thorarchaeota archaeon]
MSDKIYVIGCSKELESLGMDRVRTHVEGLDEIEIAVDWSKAKFVPVVADEKMPFQAGESKIVSIRPIPVPAYAMVVQSFYGANGMGHLFCIGSLTYRPYTEDRVADKAMFHSHIKAAVLKGDLLGQVLVVAGRKL